MLGKTSRLGLSRRVTAYYLMFGLGAVVWLVIGVAVVVKSVLATPLEAHPGIWQTIRLASEYAPVAFLCPMALVVLGIIVLRRTVRPMADIEGQLQRAATASSLAENDLRPVTGPTPAETGWNRLVRHLGQDNRRGRLDARLGQALEEYRQNKSEQILNSLADGIAVTDENNRVAFANKAILSLLGVGAAGETPRAESMEQYLPLDAGGDAAAKLLDPKLRGRAVVVEIGRPGDGSSQGTLRVARSPLHCAEGGANGCVWSVRDVTQQKLADQMRDQFLNAATHELRTPMANIKAYAEMLAIGEVVDVEQQKSFCNIINDEVTRLASFIDDLLDLSRMEVGATTLKRQTTDMERLLKEVADKVQPQMEQKKITFESDLPGKLPELAIDKEKFTAALINLLGNAAKYTPEGGRVRLHVELSQQSMQIHVEDSGIGISIEEIPKILEKFFRSSDLRVHDQTGSGLGLSLANEIVRLHGGKIRIQSELNKGSTFTVVLPTSPE